MFNYHLGTKLITHVIGKLLSLLIGVICASLFRVDLSTIVLT
jgi:hypothetical protein